MQQVGLSEQDLGNMENHGYGIDDGEFEILTFISSTMSSDEITSDWEDIRPKMKSNIIPSNSCWTDKI